LPIDGGIPEINTKLILFNPSDVNSKAKVISDRSYQDVYTAILETGYLKNELGEYTSLYQ
jgi:hypothetical protein